MFYIKEYIAGKFFPLIRQGALVTFNSASQAQAYLDLHKQTGHIPRGSKVAKRK